MTSQIFWRRSNGNLGLIDFQSDFGPVADRIHLDLHVRMNLKIATMALTLLWPGAQSERMPLQMGTNSKGKIVVPRMPASCNLALRCVSACIKDERRA